MKSRPSFRCDGVRRRRITEPVSSTEEKNRAIRASVNKVIFFAHISPKFHRSDKSLEQENADSLAALRSAQWLRFPDNPFLIDSSDEFSSFEEDDYRVKIKRGDSWSKFKVRKGKLHANQIQSTQVTQIARTDANLFRIYSDARDERKMDFGLHRGKTFLPPRRLLQMGCITARRSWLGDGDFPSVFEIVQRLAPPDE
jgi:hypothetical protein